jgi:small-conductance mechanosensitive channel
MIDWLQENWLFIVAPLIVFIAFFIVSLWVRRVVFNAYSKVVLNSKWEGHRYILQSTRAPFLHWMALLGIYAAVHLSVLPELGREIADRIIGSLLTVSVFWVLITVSEKLVRHYLTRLPSMQNSVAWIVNFLRIAFIAAGVLAILDIWGAPTTPLILIIATTLLVVILATRNAILNIFAGFEIAGGTLVKPGDYIKLQSGEEGNVVSISLENTRIQSLEKNIIVIPNSKLVQTTIVNYGRPLKRAKEPFKFYSRLHLKELTGIKAGDIFELLKGLETVPDSVIYYHTHRFIEEHHYLIPEPANDFAVWVADALDDSILSEKLANVDTYEFASIGALRKRIIAVIEEHLSKQSVSTRAAPGGEFYFIKSVGLVMPTPYVANDLREFVEILRKISLNSLYFHMFESRLHLERGINDFSAWLSGNLDEVDIANSISRLDPYHYTLSGLRSAVIQLIEKRIK